MGPEVPYPPSSMGVPPSEVPKFPTTFKYGRAPQMGPAVPYHLQVWECPQGVPSSCIVTFKSLSLFPLHLITQNLPNYMQTVNKGTTGLDTFNSHPTGYGRREPIIKAT